MRIVVALPLLFTLLAGCAEPVEELPEDTRTAPDMAFSKNSVEATVTIIRVEGGQVWSDFWVRGCASVPEGTMEAGDRMTGCTGTVTIAHRPTNALVYETTF